MYQHLQALPTHSTHVYRCTYLPAHSVRHNLFFPANNFFLCSETFFQLFITFFQVYKFFSWTQLYYLLHFPRKTEELPFCANFFLRFSGLFSAYKGVIPAYKGCYKGYAPHIYRSIPAYKGKAPLIRSRCIGELPGTRGL